MQKHRLRILTALTPCILLVLSACAPIISGEKPLNRWEPDMRGKVSEQVSGNRSPELLVFLAFSGGGTRAAAFAYGLLRELARTEVVTGTGVRLLAREIDAISSVSGGSFTAAYFGLFGER